VMTNIAQTINVLQAVILTDGPRMITTPTYHVYDMYQTHQGAEAVRVVVDAPKIGFHVGSEKRELFGLAGSASLSEKTLTVTLVNPHATDAAEVSIRLRGDASCSSARKTVLAHSDIHAHNTFEAPDVVKPVSDAAKLSGKEFTYLAPPASVTRLDLKLRG